MASYRAELAANLVQERLGALTLVYHRRSGATHLIAEPMPQILAALGTGPMDATGIAAVLGAQFELGAAPVSAIAARLAELAELGLVREVPGDA